MAKHWMGESDSRIPRGPLRKFMSNKFTKGAIQSRKPLS